MSLDFLKAFTCGEEHNVVIKHMDIGLHCFPPAAPDTPVHLYVDYIHEYLNVGIV